MVAQAIVPFLIVSLSANAGIIGNGLANLPTSSLPRMDKANRLVGTYDVTPPFGSVTIRVSDRWTAATSGLSGGDYTFSVADATSGGTSQAPVPTVMRIAQNITSFSGTNGSQFTVDDETVLAQNANKSWSLTQPDANTLRFSVQSGDYWSTSGWSDLTNDGGANRSEIEFSPRYAAGTQINISETLTVEPGATNTASFLDLNQLHSTTQSPPSPFVLGLDKSDHLVVVLQSPTTSWNVVYRSPDPIVRGQPMDLNFQLNMGPSGNGYVGVWLDGTQIVNYHGAVGATGAEYFWKEGIYRGPAAETITAEFSNVQITTPPMPFSQSGR